VRIGVCVRTWGERGGIGVYTRSIVKSLVESDRENEYCLFYADPAYLGTFAHAENVKELHVSARGKWMWDQWAVVSHARRENVDVLFHTKFAIPLLAKCKTAMVLHGTERFVFPQHYPLGDVLFFKTVYPQYLKRASLILAVSNRARTDVIEKMNIDPERVRVAYLAADPAFRVIRDPALLASVRERYRLPERFLLSVGHVYPGKNVGRLLGAFAKLRREADIQLVIAGSPRWKYRNDLDLIDRLGLREHVVLAGHVGQDDLVAFYNLAEAVVFPSHYESFGLINVEANACGCPLLTSRTGGSPEAAGDAAVFVDPMNEDDIFAGMSRILSDESLRRDLIEKGFANAKRFSWERTASETLSALSWVAARG
jgi:glycosyltransferase involved in cell wall biosynthesis